MDRYKLRPRFTKEDFASNTERVRLSAGVVNVLAEVNDPSYLLSPVHRWACFQKCNFNLIANVQPPATIIGTIWTAPLNMLLNK